MNDEGRRLPEESSLRERNRERRRNAILDACAKELASHTEDELSVDEVARRAEVSRATVFNYFATKRDIVVGIACREIEALAELKSERVREGASPFDTVSELMYRLVALSFAEPIVSWRVLRDLFDDPCRADVPLRRLLELIADLMGESQRRGETRPDLDPSGCARAIVGTYLVELFTIVETTDAESGPQAAPPRAEFDAVAEQLVSAWRVSVGTDRGRFER